MDFFPASPIATWNPARDVWETDQASLFCEHSGVYSEILPRCGMMRSGSLYRLPTPEPLIAANGFSFGAGDFPTPSSRDWKSGRSSLMDRNARPLSEVVYNLLPTPTAILNKPAPWREGVDWWLQSRATRNLEGVVVGNTPLLKTPTAQLAVNGGSQHPDKRVEGGHGPTLADQVEHLLPTPSAGVFNDGESLQGWEERRKRNLAKGINGNGQGTPLAIAVQQDWGIFSGAIARWEAVLGRPSPIPTEPGRTAPRLSPRFVEWLMGLPEGWVTDVPGLARKHQLHALGNGCVPQQAVLALKIMLGD